MKARFNQEVQHASNDLEVQLRTVARMLVKLTDSRTRPKDTADTQLSGMCLIWLAQSRVSDWTVPELYNWWTQQ